MIRILSVVALLCGLFVLQPALAQEATEQPSGTIQVEDSATQDAAIAVRIRDILAELDGYSDVTVTVTSGIVTLRGTTLDASAATRLNELVGRVAGVVAIENQVTETTDVVERLNPAVERFVARMTQIVAYLPLLLVAALAFVIVVLLGFLLARLKRPWDRLAPNAFIADIYRQILRLAFIVAGLVVALDILGATALLSTILGAAGIIGLAIGFAVRDTVENFIASVLLSIRQPFRPNDAIEIGGDEGKVIRLTSRATILLSYDGNHIRIPNATVFKSRIVNYSRNTERRFKFDISVAPNTDLAMALQVAQDTLNGLHFVLQTPAVNVWIESVGDSTINLRMTGWVDQTDTSLVGARSEAIRMALIAFEQAGIEMPEPSFRLLTQAPESAPSARPQPHVSAGGTKGSAMDVDASAEQELEQIVEDERETTREDDLLKTDAPEE